MEDPQPKIKMTPILYDTKKWHDGFLILSSKFIEEYENKYGARPNVNILKSIRNDEKYIDIFNQLGSDESSNHDSYICIKFIPEELKPYYKIVKNGFGEKIMFNYNEINKKIYNEIIEKDDYSKELRQRVKRLEYIKKNMNNPEHWE
jgi:hypothetical protein